MYTIYSLTLLSETQLTTRKFLAVGKWLKFTFNLRAKNVFAVFLKKIVHQKLLNNAKSLISVLKRRRICQKSTKWLNWKEIAAQNSLREFLRVKRLWFTFSIGTQHMLQKMISQKNEKLPFLLKLLKNGIDSKKVLSFLFWGVFSRGLAENEFFMAERNTIRYGWKYSTIGRKWKDLIAVFICRLKDGLEDEIFQFRFQTQLIIEWLEVSCWMSTEPQWLNLTSEKKIQNRKNINFCSFECAYDWVWWLFSNFTSS